MLLVVLRVLLAIGIHRGYKSRFQLRHISRAVHRHKQRANLRPDKVVRAARAQVRQCRGILAVYKPLHFGQIGEAANQPLLLRDQSAYIWHQLQRQRLAILAGLGRRTAKRRRLAPLFMRLHKLAQLVDDRDRVHVRLALRLAPCKQAMPAEHNAVAVRILLHRAAQHHCQLKARPLPRHPRQLVPELRVELLHLRLAVGCRGQCNAPVRMQVVHMREGKKSMQRSVNRGRHRVLAKCAQRIKIHNRVFFRDAFVLRLQCAHAIQIKRGKPRAPDTAQVAAAAFHPQYFGRRACQRIVLHNLRAGVAAAKVGNAQIGAQQVRAIAQKLRRIEPGSNVFIPKISQKAQSCIGFHGSHIRPVPHNGTAQTNRAIIPIETFARTKARWPLQRMASGLIYL